MYTWVNPGDRLWRRKFEAALRDDGHEAGEIDRCPQRYGDHRELQFSLRSLDRFAGWVRKIYIVTSGQRPVWLDEGCANVEIVAHDAIFPDARCLPTFNSHAIELNLHRIPGLSRHFLYLNDDLFFGRESCAADFVEDGKSIWHSERTCLVSDLRMESISDRACLETLDRVAAHLGRRDVRWMPAHAPQLYDRDVIGELETRFAEDFLRTRASRFRAADDFVLRIAYAMLAFERGQRERLLEWGSSRYAFLRMTGNPVHRLRDLAAIRRLRPKFFCLNDDLPEGWRGALLSMMMKAFLTSFFPRPSRFERTGSAVAGG